MCGGSKSNSANIARASHSSHSDSDTQAGMLCFKNYRIANQVDTNDPRYVQKEWGPDPAPPCHNCEHDSGMGLEEDGMCMDRSGQSLRANEDR